MSPNGIQVNMDNHTLQHVSDTAGKGKPDSRGKNKSVSNVERHMKNSDIPSENQKSQLNSNGRSSAPVYYPSQYRRAGDGRMLQRAIPSCKIMAKVKSYFNNTYITLYTIRYILGHMLMGTFLLASIICRHVWPNTLYMKNAVFTMWRLQFSQIPRERFKRTIIIDIWRSLIWKNTDGLLFKNWKKNTLKFSNWTIKNRVPIANRLRGLLPSTTPLVTTMWSSRFTNEYVFRNYESEFCR